MNMLKELAQALNQILTEVETLRRENEELKAEKQTFNHKERVTLCGSFLFPFYSEGELIIQL